MALNKINLSDAAETDIRNAVNAGKIATAHEAQINFNGWVGEGYTLVDPNTGAGAYMIAGGGNGAHLTDRDLGGLTAIFGLMGLGAVVLAGAFVPLVAAIMFPLLAWFLAFTVIGLYAYVEDGGKFDVCAGLTAAGIAFTIFATILNVFLKYTIDGVSALIKAYVASGVLGAKVICSQI